MACPKKFSDLHKSVDDSFSKDYYAGVFNTKIANDYNMDKFGKGTMTSKLNFVNNAPSSEIEFKHTYGGLFKQLEGLVVTKNIYSGNSDMKFKMEKSCKSGGKVSFTSNFDMNSYKLSKSELNIDYGKDKLTANLNVTPEDGCMGLKSVGLNAVVAAAGNTHIGANVSYGLAKGNIDHHLKLVHTQNDIGVHVGLKNANDVEFSLAIPRKGKFMDFYLFDLKSENLFLKNSYNMQTSDWGSKLSLEYSDCHCMGATFSKGKLFFDFKNKDFGESWTIPVNDNLSVTTGYKSNVSGFWDKMRLGTQMNFSL